MKRTLWTFLLAVTLSACQQASSVLSWVSPSRESTITGTVELAVRAADPELVGSVTFFADNKRLGEGELSDSVFSFPLDTTAYPAGELTLRAVPRTGAPLTTIVNVVSRSGGHTVSTPGAPRDDDPATTDPGDDPLNLGGIIDLWPGGAQSPAAEAALNMPSGFPWGSLYPAEALRAQVRSLLSPTQASETVKLPRGSYVYNEELEAWEGTPADAGDFQIAFSYPDPETGEMHNIKINVIWDQYAPTTVVTSPNGDIEVPQGAWFFVQDNEEDILNLDIEATWYTPDGCNEPTLFPKTLALTGWINGPRPVDSTEPAVSPAQAGDPSEAPESTLETSDLSLEMALEDWAGGGKTLTTTLAMSALTDQGFEVVLGWTAELAGDVAFDDCLASGARLDSLGLSTEAKLGPEEGPYSGSSLTLSLFGLEYDGDGVPIAGELEGELLTFDEQAALEETTTAEALLGFSEQDGFTVEGDVTLPDGSQMDVVEYVQMILDIYTQRALEGAPNDG